MSADPPLLALLEEAKQAVNSPFGDIEWRNLVRRMFDALDKQSQALQTAEQEREALSNQIGMLITAKQNAEYEAAEATAALDALRQERDKERANAFEDYRIMNAAIVKAQDELAALQQRLTLSGGEQAFIDGCKRRGDLVEPLLEQAFTILDRLLTGSPEPSA